PAPSLPPLALHDALPISDSVSIFLRAPSWEVCERRLRQRHTEGEAAVARRLEAARAELARQGEFDHVVINDDLDAAVARVRGLIDRKSTRLNSSHRTIAY